MTSATLDAGTPVATPTAPAAVGSDTASQRPARRRYAVVGTGQRARTYVDGIGEHDDVAELVALVDTNGTRLRYHADRLRDAGRGEPALFAAEDLERMLDDVAPDVVVVTSPDRTHAAHVATALAHGADVVVEKPLTIDAGGMYTIADAVRRSEGRLTVAHNYRYSPRNAALRQVVADGRIGDVVSVHFEWLLDTAHGADYFRRWHREKKASGGLLVHKASHHFDLVNWWTGDVPESVFARGGLRFYGRPQAAGPQYAPDLSVDDDLRALYLDAAHEDGYRRDQDPFAPGATIEDTLSVLVGYRSGATLTYALTAHSPWEGYRVAVNGTRGRAELEVVERCHTTPGLPGQLGTAADGGGDCCPSRPRGARLVVQEHWGRPEEIPLPVDDGHRTGDAALLRDVLRGHLAPSDGGPDDDPLGRRAGLVDGLRAVAVGVAGNRSLATGQVVPVSTLGTRL
jgi:predicted dehydrogenase